MDISVKPGKYVIAVSGGVDSMVLLDILAGQVGINLIVAHFNHGIREDSVLDEELVERAAKQHNLPIEIGRANLGAATSEARARQARYEFLNKVKEKYGAHAIITAHHQDDLIETAFINILRGTGSRGLTAMVDNPDVIRPLLRMPKDQIKAYATQHNIAWRQDSTNEQEKYLRNYLRKIILPKLSDVERQKMLANISKLSDQTQLKQKILGQLADYVFDAEKVDRARFANLSADASSELLVYWLRQNGFYDYSSKLITDLGVFIKTGRPGAKLDLSKKFNILLTKRSALIEMKG